MKEGHQKELLRIARESISRGLRGEQFGYPDVGHLPKELQVPGATFVTLTIQGALRGCIGMLEACRPVAEDVAANARAAAFNDPRFEPLSAEELDQLQIQISVLTLPEELNVSSEREVLSIIEPDVDGLILQDGCRKGTFLPSVWEDLPDKELFLMHLKMKAGLPADHWTDTLRVFRYRTECFSEEK